MATSALAQVAVPAQTIAQTNAYASQARAWLDDDLKDYPSARFRNVRATFSPRLPGGENWITFCGEINAKNEMGGYTGWTRFALLPGDQQMLLTEDSGLGTSAVPRMCASGNEVWLATDFTPQFKPAP